MSAVESLRPAEPYSAIKKRLWNPRIVGDDPEKELPKNKIAAALRPANTPEPIINAPPKRGQRTLESIIKEAMGIVSELERKAAAGAERQAQRNFLRDRVKTIQRETARFYDIDRADIIGSGRSAFLVLPRQVAMHLTKTLLPHVSTVWVGRMFGGRDHSTALHGIRKIKRLLETNDRLRAEVELITARLAALGVRVQS